MADPGLLMAVLLRHLPVLPIVIPLLGGAAIMLFAETRREARAAVSISATLLQLLAAVALLVFTDGGLGGPADGMLVYAVGGWAAPYGIVLFADRLAALMVLLSVLLAFAALLYSRLRWDRTGVHYHPMFQFLLMGLAGAFLTGDLFNLFVFFEILLAASYGLALHGSGALRVRAGLHYIIINLAAALVFLVAAALVYGVLGTLNMADIAHRAGQLSGQDRALFNAALALLGVVFLIKAAAWPLNFWLVPTYSAAAAPVAAMFCIMTKVGIYALLRIGLLLGDAAPAPFAGAVLLWVGVATLVFGIVGVLSAQQIERAAAYCLIISAGILQTAIGLGIAALVAPLLYYLISSVLGTAALFLLIGISGRPRSDGAAQIIAVTQEAFDIDDPQDPRLPDEVIGIPIPRAMAFLGLSFIACVLLVAGVPPLSGFVAKLTLIAAVLGAQAQAWAPPLTVFIGLLLLSGLATIIALSRIGMTLFWAVQTAPPRINVIEALPVALLVLLCVGLAVEAGAVFDYLQRTADTLHAPQQSIDRVLGIGAEGAP